MNMDLTRLFALALSGQAGAHLLDQVGMPTSADRLLRLVKRTVAPPPSVPEVLGVDKFGATLRAVGWHATLGTWFSSVLEEAARNLVNLPTNPRMIMQKSISLDAYRGNPPVAPLSAVEVVSST